ncbi:MAG: hypothetical protein J7M21_05505 [Planctomycetes bacterium]|nr:hypothetical protein [Planctomycetota bacterium]
MMLAGGQLFQAGPVDADGEQLERPVHGAFPAEQDGSAVGVEVGIEDDAG